MSVKPYPVDAPGAVGIIRDRSEWQIISEAWTDGKNFEFIDVLLSKVETNDAASSVVRQWIVEAYGEKVLPIEIPKTSVTVAASAEFGTIYDVPKGSMNAKTYSRAKDAYDRYCTLIEEQIQAVWMKQKDIMVKYLREDKK